MPQANVTIKTRDGNAPAAVFTPSQGQGPWPGVVFYMDGPGIRPVMWEMGQKMADGGYVVLLPDLYYREGPYAPKNPKDIFSNPDARAEMMRLVGTLDRDKKVSDTQAFLDYLATRTDVKGSKYGCTGYCLGGNVSLTAGGAFPDKFAAIASFHGGGLVNPSPESPHQFLKGVKGRVYVAGAIEDASFSDEAKATLESTLTNAGVEHKVETYQGKHGFAVPDLPVYDKAADERHWKATFDLFSAQL